MSISPLDPITALPGVGAARAAELADAGVARVVDLLLHLPMRYEDRTRIAPIANLIPEGPAITVKGKVLSARLIRTRRPGFTIFESLIDDGTAPLKLVFFNQPHLARWITPEKDLFAFGVASFGRGRVLQMENPQLELDEPDPLTTGRIVPIYRKLPGLAPRLRRKLVARVLDEVADHLPERLGDLPERLGLPPLGVSLREAHFPSVPDPVSFENRTSRHLLRLVFEEFLEFQLRLQTRRQARMARTAPRLVANEAIRKRLREFLPFALTNAQKRVIREIRDDFSSGRPMRRLLQGDVGSGKTIVALLSAFLAKELGYQSALMVPTEILAEQHASTIARLLAKDPLSLHPALLTGRIKGRARNALLGALEAGEVDLLVGTHALFQDPVAFHRLGLVIIDEQHRFGVAQRAALSAKTSSSAEIPHVLVMSATPIPRSLALTLYGDLDVSTIDERPPGRTPIVTRVLPEEQR
ncbi:MAG: DEAD/DEAH box helicase, partial [Acidobacteria bacterium]|nr:DEAD/DEAH box helicase [Acidobacteriota bacterium]